MSLSSYNPALDLTLTLILVCTASLLGSRCLALAGLPPAKGLLDLAFAASLGLSVVSFATMALGLVGLIGAPAVACVLVAAAAIGSPARRHLWQRLMAAAGEVRMLYSLPRVGRWSTALLLGMAGLNLVGALSPVTYSDTLNHYMALARHVVRQGRIEFEPYKWWNMPALVEMLYVDVLAVFPGAVGAPLEWAYGLLTLAALAGLGLHLGGVRAAPIGPLVYYAIPFVTQESTIAKNDLALALHGLLALAGLIQFAATGRFRWVAVAGIFAGLAMSTKLYGLLLAAGLGCALLVILARERRLFTREAAPVAALYGLAAMLVGAPWYLRAWIQGGDPIWPFGYPVFHSRAWDMPSYLKFANYELGEGTGPLALLLGPWSLTTNLAAYSGERVPVVLPIYLGLLPALLLAWKHLAPLARTACVGALVSAGVYYVVWFWLYQQPGYLVPVMALLTVPLAIAAAKLVERTGVLRLTAVAAVAMAVGFGAVVNVAYNAQFAPVVLGLESPRAFVASKSAYFDDIDYANRSLPPESKLLVFPTTDFYFDVAHVNGLPGFQGYVEYLRLDTEQALVRRWRDLGITHVFKDGRSFEAGADFVRFWSEGDDRLRRQVSTLVEQDVLEPIYHNEQAIIVESRTLSRRETGTVTIYRVNYPEESVAARS